MGSPFCYQWMNCSVILESPVPQVDLNKSHLGPTAAFRFIIHFQILTGIGAAEVSPAIPFDQPKSFPTRAKTIVRSTAHIIEKCIVKIQPVPGLRHA